MNLASYINLCKPKIVLLLTITALVGMLLSINFYSNILDGLASLLGFALLAGASAALNQIFDRETDKNMNRTKTRPLASGEISLFSALTFTAILLFVGSSLLLYFSNLLTLLITTFGFIFYSLIYTIYLKWSTPQNIVIGGLSGALPPLIGWTAVNNDISLLPLTLVLVIFLWTPPHFWPLAIDRLDEYKKEGVPMMPIAKGVSRTKKEMVVYAILLLAASLAPFFYGLTGYFYLISTTTLNLYFIYLCIAYLNDRENELSMKIFNFSVKYMFLFFLATYIDFLISLYV
jgi:protoheme IX farnesyltransferase|tara:strand:+ start:2536 stop:3402 length:867 start_codon:yes stop_codon:yes gene_type:complete